MHIKIVNTQSKYKHIVRRSNDPGQVYRRKGYGAVNRLNCCAALRGTDGDYRALTEAAQSIFLLCRLDWFWSSAGLPNMKLMVGQGSNEYSAPAIALSAAGAVFVPRVGSRMYLLRCLVRINFSTRNFRLWQRLVSWSWSLW